MDKLNAIFRWFTSVTIILCICLLAYHCLDTYFNASLIPDDIAQMPTVFHRDDVISRLVSLRLPFLFCVFLIICSILIHTFTPRQETDFLQIEPERLLQIKKAHLEELPPEAVHEERRRIWIKLISGLGIGVCLLCMTTYLVQRDNFLSWALEHVIGKMVTFIVPLLLLCFTISVITSVLCSRSIKREYELIKKLPATNSIQSSPQSQNHGISLLRIAIISIAILLLFHGILNGGLYDVFVKAINICTECVGLG